jgi:S-adenosylmethionine hydrolase
MMTRFILLIGLVTALGCVAPGHHCACSTDAHDSALQANLVIMTDFGLKDGAVSEMKGVAYSVDPHLVVSDLTHEIPPYNIWAGAYRLSQTYKYWPKGSVFVTVVDPGVGSQRHSIVLRSKSGYYFVGPDNGLYTLVADEDGVDQVRVIDEAKQRLKGSAESNTFHGRDVYVYVGARLAAGVLPFEQVGEPLSQPLVKVNYQRPEFHDGELRGAIPVLDPNYGNVWSNIAKAMVTEHFPGKSSFHVRIFNGEHKVFEAQVPLVDTFSAVRKGEPLLYFNSLLNLSLALNQNDFSSKYHISSGGQWLISIRP